MMHDGHRARFRIRALMVILFVGALLGIPYSPGLAAPAHGIPATQVPSVEWAYGGNRSFNASGYARNGTFSVSSHVGYQVLFSAESAPGGAVSVQALRTMGAVVRTAYCAPTCAAPSLSATVDLHAVERLTGFTNLTPHASVAVNGTGVSAIGIMNASSILQDALFENDTATFHGSVRDRVASADLTLGVAGHVSANFTPALGIIPSDPTPGMQWTSHAAYTGSGAWNVSSGAHRTTALGVTSSGGATVHYAANRSGNVTVEGRDLGALELRSGAITQVIGLEFLGPLSVREGVVLLPASADVFQGAAVPNSPGGNASLGETPTSVDYARSGSGLMLGLVASSATFTAQSTNPAAAPTSGITPASAGQSSGPLAVQAQPESPNDFQPISSCLADESCAGGSSAPAVPSPALRPLVAVGIGVVAVGAILASTLVVSRRPRLAPRTHPEEYPAVTAPSPSPRPRPGTAAANREASTEPDPLGHLW